MIEFWVPGRPATKGSVESRPNHTIKHTEASKDRQADIVAAAKRELARLGQPGSPFALYGSNVAVTVRYAAFFPPRPGFDVNASPIHQSDGDLDKLLRTVLDALTGVVFENDAQVQRCKDPEKFYAATSADVGEYICVESINPRRTGRLATLFEAREAIMRSRGFSDPRNDIPVGF